jgi:hypothetical protein
MSTFTILKQQTSDGCIPACAASLLRHLGVPKSDWSEAGLLAMYLRPAATGFDTLKQFLEGQPELADWEVIINQDTTKSLKDLATAVVKENGPALLPLNQGSGNKAHCVVIIDPSETGADICDPDKNRPDRQTTTWADIEKTWARGLLYLRKKARG